MLGQPPPRFVPPPCRPVLLLPPPPLLPPLLLLPPLPLDFDMSNSIWLTVTSRSRSRSRHYANSCLVTQWQSFFSFILLRLRLLIGQVVNRWVCTRVLLAVAVSIGPCFATAQAADARLHEPWVATGVLGRLFDGDTFDLRSTDRGVIRVRFGAIDTPERGQAYSRKAREHLGKLLRAGPITARCYKDDGRSREICLVTVQGQDVGLQMIEAGLAWHFKRFEHEQTHEAREAYSEAETKARTERVGLWAFSEPPMPPWECRQRLREGFSCR